LLLEPDCFRGRLQTLSLSALLRGICRGLLRVALTLGVGLLALRLGLGLKLGVLAVALNPLLAFLFGDFVLQALALLLDLGLLLGQVRLVLALLGFASLAGRFGLGVNLSLLQAALTGQIVIPDQRAGDFLGFTSHRADDPAASALPVLLITQFVHYSFKLLSVIDARLACRQPRVARTARWSSTPCGCR
jgi:hypothetical protein